MTRRLKRLRYHIGIIVMSIAVVASWILYVYITRPDVIEGSLRALSSW